MHTTGSCFCGTIEWEAEIDPNMTGVCHCRDCQIFSGGAFRTVGAVPYSAFGFTKGEPKFFDKVAESGKTRRMAFCDNCGTHLCSLPVDPEEEGAFVSVRLATSDQFDQFTPAIEVFCSSKVAWLPDLEGMVQFPKMPE